MSKLEDMKSIVVMALQSPVHEFSLEYEGVKLTFKKAEHRSLHAAPDHTLPAVLPGSAEGPGVHAGVVGDDVKPEPAPGQPQHAEIASTMIGTFYIGPEPDAPPFVKVGDRVARDTVVGVVEAMKLYHELQADMDGTIEEILVENGQLVHYGQPLFVVRLT